ncbi:MAG TPA: 50S ribosomal protein L21 [Candidatus Paceibacterota bacterium]|nr:50S ribosomal protein L21 [Candidatus Paceibacterota bacterium]
MDFAVIKTGGKQYIVREGDILDVEKLVHDSDTVVFDQVLLIADKTTSLVGQPLVDGATVKATVLADGKGEKKLVFRYKSKTRYHKKKGHRQPFTRVRIDAISARQARA